MDRKVIKITELNRLHGIANIAAFLTMEIDLYIGLVMAVEQYIENPSEETFEPLCEMFNDCREHYPRFHEARQGQINLLVETGHLKVSTIQDLESLEMYEHPSAPDIEEETNIIQLFPGKKVDKED